MADKRFFVNKGPFSIQQLAEIVGECEVRASDVSKLIEDVASLDAANETKLSFFSNAKYVDAFRASNAGLCIVSPDYVSLAPQTMDLLISKDPYYSYALVAQAFYPEEEDYCKSPVATSATIGSNAVLSPGAVIGENAIIGDNVFIGRNSVIGRGVVIGDNTIIKDNVTITHSILGKGCRIFPGVRIGQDGFGFATYQGRHVSIPQIGRVIIGDYVEIGANTTVDRGAGPDTEIGDGCRIDNLVQIGHNVKIGRGCVIVAQAGVAGSTVLEDYVVLGGQVGVAGHLRVGMGAQIAAQSGVAKNVESGQKLGGSPAVPMRQWHRQSILLANMAINDKNNN